MTPAQGSTQAQHQFQSAPISLGMRAFLSAATIMCDSSMRERSQPFNLAFLREDGEFPRCSTKDACAWHCIRGDPLSTRGRGPHFWQVQDWKMSATGNPSRIGFSAVPIPYSHPSSWDLSFGDLFHPQQLLRNFKIRLHDFYSSQLTDSLPQQFYPTKVGVQVACKRIFRAFASFTLLRFLNMLPLAWVWL